MRQESNTAKALVKAAKRLATQYGWQLVQQDPYRWRNPDGQEVVLSNGIMSGRTDAGVTKIARVRNHKAMTAFFVGLPVNVQSFLAWARSEAPRRRKGKVVLRSADDEYCFLGLLADFWIRQTGAGSWDREPGSPFYVLHARPHQEHVKLPDAAVKWYQLRDGHGTFFGPAGQSSISQLNDRSSVRGQWSFTDLLHWMRSEPPGLFAKLAA